MLGQEGEVPGWQQGLRCQGLGEHVAGAAGSLQSQPCAVLSVEGWR